jgi:uncharacterized membrane protein
LIEWTAADIQPPLYYLLIWVTDIIFDESEWALRFPSVIFNTLTVPLIYVQARRLFDSPVRSRHALDFVPFLAATLFTLSPVMVYYSQEARMYTLLTFEATLASYLLFKILSLANNFTRIRPASFTLFYILTIAAMLYTHYFAAFLLTAHALYALFILQRQRFPRSLFAQLLWGFSGSLLLFTPWLPILLARLGDDPSYWPGALKLDEALRKVAISFTVGETVFEQIGWRLALGYFALLLICSLWALLTRPLNKPETTNNEPNRASSFTPAPALGISANVLPHSSFLFLLLWLILPILLILILSYQSPKFNSRYTLLAWPPFALCLAYLLAQFRPSKSTPFLPCPTHYAIRFTFYVLRFTFYVFILSTIFYSLTNWFTDPRFSKDDFRALAQFVRERKTKNETVLLSSGHLFPVWAYYYGWTGWTPLPWMLRLDVHRVTDLSIAANIAEAIEEQRGVWLVTWQDEVIDPNGVVPFWLDLIGRRPVDAGDFWGVGLEHWRLDPAKIALLRSNPIKWPTTINFANQLELVGYTQLDDTELALFWRPRQPLPDDLILTLDLTDADNFDWARKSSIGRPGAYLYPPSRWPVNQTIMTRHRLNWQIGTPPGLYTAEISLGQAGQKIDPTTAQAAPAFTSWDILDGQGRPQRRTALLEFINLSHLIEPKTGPLPLDTSPLIDFFPIIGLRRSILPQDTAQPGDRVLLALLWQAGQFNLDDISILIDLVDAQGQRHRIASSLTPSRRFNLPRWRPGDMVLGQYWLDIPTEAAPGRARLELHLLNETGWSYHEIFPFDEIEILPTERNFSPPEQVAIPLEADFSGQTTLIGVDCPANCQTRPGGSVVLTLYWQADAPFDKNYTVFTHLLGPDETVLVNADHTPPKPTLGWVPNEIIADSVNLTIPPNLPPGSYAIEVGLYDAADPAYQRLPLAEGQTRLILPKLLAIE